MRAAYGRRLSVRLRGRWDRGVFPEEGKCELRSAGFPEILQLIIDNIHRGLCVIYYTKHFLDGPHATLVVIVYPPEQFHNVTGCLGQMDIVILQKGKLRLGRILISAIANTIANKCDGARIWPWALSLPESRLFDLLFPLVAFGF